jgi:uncharacterized protein (TIGR00661 family)
MATLYYSMAGEGKGHAIRARVVVERLRTRHRLVLYASRDAYRFLAPLYSGGDVTVRELSGLHFKYGRDGHLDLPRTVAGGATFLGELGGIVARVADDIRREKPDLAITDFEPALPRAAQRCGLPFISLNHQHFLVVSDLTSLPGWLQRHAFMMSVVVRGFYSGQRETIVSSFHNPPPRKAWRHARQIGVLLRGDVLAARPECRGHVMAYFRKFASARILAALKNCGRPVKAFGLGVRDRDGNIAYSDGGEPEFLEALSTCDALVTTAGNQLVGEALYLRKPVFALPESGNYEQYINAHCLAQGGGGAWADMERVQPGDLRRFLGRLDDYRSHMNGATLDGTAEAVRLIEAQLS